MSFLGVYLLHRGFKVRNHNIYMGDSILKHLDSDEVKIKVEVYWDKAKKNYQPRIKGRKDIIGRNMKHQLVDWDKCTEWVGEKK